MLQLNLFEHVALAYAQPVSGRLTQDELYRISLGRAGVDRSVLTSKDPIGQSGQHHNKVKRAIRWHQQTLKQMGFLQMIEGERGVWELTAAGRSHLRQIRDGVAALGFSTDLGIAIWGNCHHVFSQWSEPIFLALTSPPYMLRNPRAYGNCADEQEYIDFICRIFEPIVRNLVPGGNIALSISNDIFQSKSPARSLYLEKLTLSLSARLGLSLMDRLIWESNKPPGPIQWTSKKRVQLNTGYEYVLYFCNDPDQCLADNRRALEPHTEKHLSLMQQGGEKRDAVYSDGAYRVRPGSYGAMTEGKIARNVLHVSNVCHSQRQYKKQARELGLQAHGASMPLELARKLVKFLSDVDQLVVDPCFGSGTTALACEELGRRWAGTDIMFDYVRGAAERFRSARGFKLALP